MVKFPHNLVAGETLDVRVCHATATSITIIVAGPAKHTLTLIKSGDEWAITQETDEWAAGLYKWEAWIHTTAGKSVGGSGRFTLTASLASAEDGADNRTLAEKNIEALETMLSGKASSGVKRYRINNRELENYSLTELTDLLTYWKGVRRRERSRGRLGPNIRVAL